jgi:hypothetical protein
MIVVVTGRSSPDALSAVRASAPGADATIVTLCDRTAQASTSEGVLGSSFVLDGSTPAALEQTWRRLVGVTTESGVAT